MMPKNITRLLSLLPMSRPHLFSPNISLTILSTMAFANYTFSNQKSLKSKSMLLLHAGIISSGIRSLLQILKITTLSKFWTILIFFEAITIIISGIILLKKILTNNNARRYLFDNTNKRIFSFLLSITFLLIGGKIIKGVTTNQIDIIKKLKPLFWLILIDIIGYWYLMESDTEDPEDIINDPNTQTRPPSPPPPYSINQSGHTYTQPSAPPYIMPHPYSGSPPPYSALAQQ